MWGVVIFLWGFVLIMTALGALALIWFGPAKPRASGTNAVEQCWCYRAPIKFAGG